MTAVEKLILLIPVIGGMTGWLIMSLVIRIIFRPALPVKMPFINLRVRGLLPGKQEYLAETLREVVKTQLELAATGDASLAADVRTNLTDTVVGTIREHIRNRLPFLVPRGVRQKISDTIEEIVRKEITDFFDDFVYDFRKDRGAASEFCRFIEQKIRNYDLADLEKKIKETPHFFYLKGGAALIGLCSGMLQLLVALIAKT